jgi:hypothetical protein
MARTALHERSRIDSTLHYLQRRGTRLGVYGRRRVWFWVAVVAWGLRAFRNSTGAVPSVVYRSELRPGEAILVSHRPETYAGKRVRSRRRKPVA